MTLDYTIKDADERKQLVDKIIKEANGELTNTELQYLANYLLFTVDGKQTIKERDEEYPVITKNRQTTIDKRQQSLESFATSLPGGVDSAYHMIITDPSKSKGYKLDNKEPISKKDIAKIPGIKEKLAVVDDLEKALKQEDLTSAQRYSLKQQVIETYKEVYMIRENVKNRPQLQMTNSQLSLCSQSIPIEVEMQEETPGSGVFYPHVIKGPSLLDEKSVKVLLKNYVNLKQETYDNFQSDINYILWDLEELVIRALQHKYPLYLDLLVMKIRKTPGEEIVKRLQKEYGETHSEQYYSSLWVNRIPKIISQKAREEYVINYYTYEEPMGISWKVCGKCGKELPAHPYFFSPNTTKDGYYSICKECRRQQ